MKGIVKWINKISVLACIKEVSQKTLSKDDFKHAGFSEKNDIL